MVYQAGLNTANFNNCAIWNAATGNVTTVGANGGPSAYGTYDQAGNVDEWVANSYSLGGSYADSVSGLVIPSGLIIDTSTAASAGLGFRIVGKDYTNLMVSFQGPKFYSAGNQLNHSISITNDELFPVEMDFNSSLDPKITSNTWIVSYGVGSSGILGGSGIPSGNLILGPSSYATINMVSEISPLATSSIVLSIELLLNEQFAPMYTSMFSTTIFASVNNASNYTQRFANASGWNSISPNSFSVIGDPSNVPFSGTVPLASIPYNYLMSKYEITNIEYTTFLNAIDPEGLNPNDVYDNRMNDNSLGGISYSNLPINGLKYSVKPNMGNKPVNYVTCFSAARYCNWLHNGALSYSTTSSSDSAPQNSGVYNIIPPFFGSPGVISSPNSAAKFRLPLFEEWLKAAYYSAGSLSGTYYSYANQYSVTPSGTVADMITGNGQSLIYDNSFNYQQSAFWDPIYGDGSASRYGPTTVGTNGAPSAYDLFDMNGNVREMVLLPGVSTEYLYMGGAFDSGDSSEMILTSSSFIIGGANNAPHSNANEGIGFRLFGSILEGDIRVSSIASAIEYIQNEEVTITLTILNNSSHSVDENNLSVDISGPELESLSWTASYPSTSSSPSSGLSKSIRTQVSLGSGESVVYVFTIKTIENTTVPILFTATINPPAIFYDTNITNNSTSLIINSKPTNLSIELDGPLEYSQLENLTYYLSVKNIGNYYIDNVDVLLTHSGALLDSFIWSANYTGSSGELSGTNVLYTSLSNIVPSGEATYTISVVPSATTIQNLILNAELIMPSGISDTDLSNNTSSLVATIRPTDLKVSVSAPSTYTQKLPIPVVVEIQNTGQYSPSTQLNVSFSGASYSDLNWSSVYSSGSSGPMSGVGNIITSGINLANSGSATFQISYIPSVASLEPLRITATVSPQNPLTDSDENNNVYINTPINLSPVDISVSMSGDSFYKDGQRLTYNIIVNNNSPNAVSGINLISYIPTGISNLRWGAAYVSGNGPVGGSGNINSSFYLASSGYAIYGIDSIADSGIIYPIEIDSYISLPIVSGLTDPNLSNNVSSLDIQPQVYIDKVSFVDSNCGNNGNISISIGGGLPPFRYTIGSISFTTSDRNHKFTGLAAGDYDIVVIDSTNTVILFPTTVVIEDNILEATINNIYAPTLLDSFGILNLSVTCKLPFSLIFIKDTGERIEIPAFDTKYLVSKSDHTYSYKIYDLLTPGEYEAIIIDNKGCSIVENITIPNAQAMSVNISVIPDNPIIINSPLLSLDIFDTLLIPYHYIQNNSELWQLIKNYNLKDYIYIYINNERYEFRVVRTMLDKYCLDENKIEILKLGNTSLDWYFYLYIAPSINLTTNPEFMGASIKIGTTDGSVLFDIVLGLSEDGQLEQDHPSLIRGSILLNGVTFPDLISGFSANISVGVNDIGEAKNDFTIENIKKTQLRNIYNAGIVTAINFLENMSILNEYVMISQTACNTLPEDYKYLVNIKNLLVTINNWNNIGNIYLFNAKNITSTGQLNCFANIATSILTENGNVENSYTTEYFTFDQKSNHISKFVLNNQEVKNVGVLGGIDSRYVIARIKDNYNNSPNSIIYENSSIVTYDEHFVKSQQIIQQINSNIINDFLYGDILIYIPILTPEENAPAPLDPSPVSPIPPNLPQPNNTNNIPIVEISKDTSNTSSLVVKVFPTNTKCILYGPKNYQYAFIGDTNFINVVPGIYKIIGETEDLKNKNLYQNEYRVIIDKNTSITQIIEFFSYANRLFVTKENY